MNTNSIIKIRDARLPNDIDFIKKLWTDYLTWGNDKMQMLYGVHPHNPTEAVKDDIKKIDKFLPPNGRLIMAFVDEKACGIGCLKSINEEIGEIKRMYLDPSFRQIGAGRAILQALLNAAKETGYKKVRLDSPKFMEAAHTLYRSVGFKDIEPYPEMEIPQEFKDYLLFMEIDLS
ncbi:GNAT family N-acetyltransferase [Emticicia sp.]|uniref:GNAT family N-acetyltransferase n=1 Tax=Emticicia sp. TaxID=1930953 RepID=UPI003752D45F